MQIKPRLFPVFWILVTGLSAFGSEKPKDLAAETAFRYRLFYGLADRYCHTEPHLTVYYGHQALIYAKRLNEPEKICQALRKCSDGFLEGQNPDSAMAYARQALAISLKSRSFVDIMRARNQIGLAFMKKGQNQEAVDILSLALDNGLNHPNALNPPDGFRDALGEVLNYLTQAHIRSGNFPKAKQTLLKHYQETGIENSFLGMLFLGNLSSIYQNEGLLDSALICAEKALVMAQNRKEPINESNLRMEIGNTYYQMGKFSQALTAYSAAIELLQAPENKSRLAALYNNLGSVYKETGQFDKANQYFLQSASLKEALKDSAGMATTFNNIGLVYNEAGNMKMALHYLHKAIRINTRKKNYRSLGTNYTGVANVYADLHQADSALANYSRSLDLKTRAGHKYGMVKALHGLGMVYFDLLKNHVLAGDYFRKALDLASSIGSESEVAHIQLNLGELYLQEKQYVLASGLFKKTLAYANQENALELIRESALNLTLVSIRSGEKEAGVAYFEMFQTASDSLFNRDKAKTVLELQTRFDTERKEKENQELTRQNRDQQRQILFLGIFLVILAVALGIIFYFTRSRKLAYQRLVIKNLELLEKERKTPPVVTPEPSPNPSSETDTDFQQVLFEKLIWSMETEKLFLNPGLSLEDVSLRLKTNRTYLSKIINDRFQRNFNAYLNDLRVKEAMRILSDPAFAHFSVEGIGLQAGFSSKVSFHSHFKQQAGVTPSFFRKSAGGQP